MCKRFVSLMLIFSLIFALGTGVFAMDGLSIPTSGSIDSMPYTGNNLNGTSPDMVSGSYELYPVAESPDNTEALTTSAGALTRTSDNGEPLVEENNTKNNGMIDTDITKESVDSRYSDEAVAIADDIVGTKYEEAAEILGALGIMVGDAGTGNFRPNDNIIRSEMTKVAVYTLGLEDIVVSSGVSTIFPDVAPTHWASGAINIGYQQGLVVGDAIGTFRPDDNVLLQEAITIIVRALGYQPKAEAIGGYPGGYVTVASSLQLLKGINGAMNAPAKRGEIAQLVFNALTVDMMEQTEFGPNPSYETVDRTLLYDYLNVEKGYGQVLATDETSLNASEGVAEDKVQIGDTVFQNSTLSAKEYLGFNVVYYARVDASDDEKTIIAVRPQGSKNRTLSVNAEDIVSITGGDTEDFIITYWTNDGENSKTASIVAEPSVIYNGKYSPDYDFTTQMESGGSLRLVDTDVNNVYDVVFANVFTNIVVDTVSTVTGRITDKYNNSSILLDPEEESVNYTLIKNNYEITTDELKEWDVISYTISEDRTLIRAYVTTESILGTITSKSANGFRINKSDEVYKVASNYPYTLNVGDSGRFYLDHDGKIAGVDAKADVSLTATGRYGYLVNAAETGTLDSDVQFKIYTVDGEVKVFGSANKIKLGDSSGLEPADVVTRLSDGEGDVIPQLITYTTNTSGQINKITTATNNLEGDPIVDDFTFDVDEDDVVYRSSSSKLGNISVTDDTIVFDIPADADTDTDMYAVRTKAMFTNDNEYDILVYDLNEDYSASVIIVTSSTGVTNAENPIVIVDEIAETQNENEDDVDSLYGLSMGKNVTVDADALGVFVKDGDPLERGDIIQYGTNAKGEADEIRVLFDVDDKTTEFDTEVVTDLRTVYGKVTKKFSDSINLSVNGTVKNYGIRNANVYLYNSRGNTSKVSVVDTADIELYEEGNEVRVFLKLYKDTVEDIVIVK